MPFVREGNTTVPVQAIDFFQDGTTVQTASVICFDMEHPWHVKQLGEKTDLVINPSYDWRKCVWEAGIEGRNANRESRQDMNIFSQTKQTTNI